MTTSVRRLYFELVALRRGSARSAPPPLSALLAPDVLRELTDATEEAAIAGHQLRIAPLVELPDPADKTSCDASVELAYRAAQTLGEQGVAVDLWFQLPDDQTRFLNTSTAPQMRHRLEPWLERFVVRQTPVGVCLDMEPNERLLDAASILSQPLRHAPKTPTAAWRALGGVARHRLDHGRGRTALHAMDRALKSFDLDVHVAVLPPLSPSPRLGESLRARYLGCPPCTDQGELFFGRHAAMVYTTLFRQLWGRTDAERERQTLSTYGERHRRFVLAKSPDRTPAIALGMIGRGILGTEPVFNDAGELHVATRGASAMGYTDISFFCLEGLLYGPDGLPENVRTMQPTRAGREAWWTALFS